MIVEVEMSEESLHDRWLELTARLLDAADAPKGLTYEELRMRPVWSVPLQAA